jgi:F-type H+-transporting ATPase subunit epsilon
METELMSLKILLPFRVLVQEDGVRSVVAETRDGFYGFLPRRLDCVSAVVPGILTYETDSVHYVAVDEGILVKAGNEVLVSVRRGISGAKLGKLRESVEKEFKTLDEMETNVRSVAAKLESNFIQNLEKLRRR